MQPAVTKCLLWIKMYPFSSRFKLSLCPTTALLLFQLVAPERRSVRTFALQVCLAHQDDEEIHGTRAERYDLYGIVRSLFSIDRSKGAKPRTLPF